MLIGHFREWMHSSRSFLFPDVVLVSYQALERNQKREKREEKREKREQLHFRVITITPFHDKNT